MTTSPACMFDTWRVIAWLNDLLKRVPFVQTQIVVIDHDDGASEVHLSLLNLQGPLIGSPDLSLLPVPGDHGEDHNRNPRYGRRGE